MSQLNWCEILEWTEEQLTDLRVAGYSYIRQGKYDVALPFFEALVVLNQGNVYDIRTLGALYLQVDDASKSLKFLDRALELEANHVPTRLNRTKALLALGFKEQGLKLARKLKKNPDKFVSDSAQALILAYR
jgi:tetratricopeptide (TPR) repeat protein